VRIETCPRKGTTVSVYLPHANERLISGMGVPTKPTPSCPDTGTAASRRAVVLLVDDDSEVRAATAEMLRYVGHDVIEAAGGREALDHLDREGDGVDLMIVDYVMPGMNGLEVARLGGLRRPSLPILFVTGFADTAVLAAETPSDHILRKPFTVADLVAKTGAVLRIGSTRRGEAAVKGGEVFSGISAVRPGSPTDGSAVVGEVIAMVKASEPDAIRCSCQGPRAMRGRVPCRPPLTVIARGADARLLVFASSPSRHAS